MGDARPVVLFSPGMYLVPVFHLADGPIKTRADGVAENRTRCGLWWMQWKDGMVVGDRGTWLRRAHAESFATPCNKCQKAAGR